MTRIALVCFITLLGLYATTAATVAATTTTLTNRSTLGSTMNLKEEGIAGLVGSSPFPKGNEGREPTAHLHSPIVNGIISLYGGNKTELGMNVVKDNNTFFLKKYIMAVQKISIIIYPTNKKKKKGDGKGGNDQ